MASFSFEEILTPDDIFEKVISPEDVILFFNEHQKKLAKVILSGEDHWIFNSCKNNCSIKCTPKEKGNLPRVSCIGCTLSCRLSENCEFPDFFESKKIYEIGNKKIRLRKKSLEDGETGVGHFLKNCILTFLLDEIDSGGAFLFYYECSGNSILIEEMSNSAGYGFNGVIKMKNERKLSNTDLQMLVEKAKQVDLILRENKYSLKNFSPKQIMFVTDSKQKFSFRLAGKSDDVIGEDPVCSIYDLMKKNLGI